MQKMVAGRVQSVRFSGERARDYQIWRVLPERTREEWCRLLGSRLGGHRVGRILDAGAGTGQFAPYLARAFEAVVIGLDREPDMLEQARIHHPHGQVEYREGVVEDTRLEHGAVDLAWFSLVVHFLEDRGAVGREIARVLRPGGHAVVRGYFRGRLTTHTIQKFVPAVEQQEAKLPALGTFIEEWESNGLRLVGVERVVQETHLSHDDFLESLRHGPSTIREMISAGEYEAGLEGLAEAIRCGEAQGPVRDGIDLLIFEKPDAARGLRQA